MNSPRLSVRLPQETLDAIDQLIKAKQFRNRTQFTTIAVNFCLKHYEEILNRMLHDSIEQFKRS